MYSAPNRSGILGDRAWFGDRVMSWWWALPTLRLSQLDHIVVGVADKYGGTARTADLEIHSRFD
jgi:hypothetical protein